MKIGAPMIRVRDIGLVIGLAMHICKHLKFCVNGIITGRMPQSGKLPVLNLLTGPKSGFFFAPQGDSLHRFRSNLAGPTGTWISQVTKLLLRNRASVN